MIGYSDEAKVTDLLAPLRRLEALPVAVPERAERRLRRPALVVAIVVVALAVTGVAIANGVGAFNGIGAAQRPQSSEDALDPRDLPPDCSSSVAARSPFCQLVYSSARLVRTLPSGDRVWVVTDTHGDLCVIVENSGAGCGAPLDESHPITFMSSNTSPTTGGEFIASGVAIDGVTAVSFTARGTAVTVPVKDNVFAYEEPDSHAIEGQCIVVHFADGTSVDYPPTPCS
ncbi:MAG TPA: hypothetical protein VJ814_04255 [Gaiellaceae bacterium]|nr:hypothetical protein [Gaiellaceae bacterium]